MPEHIHIATQDDLLIRGQPHCEPSPERPRHELPQAVIVPEIPSDTTALAQSYLDKADEDWTYCDPQDVKRLARAVLGLTEVSNG